MTNKMFVALLARCRSETRES